MNAFFQFAEVKSNDCPLFKIAKSMQDKTMDVSELDKPIAKEICVAKGCPVEGNSGAWTGERGNSEWTPNREDVPTRYNPNNLTWGEILDKYEIENIPFKDGEPNFSEVSKGTVEINDFSDSRRKNFVQADEKLSEQRSCAPEEVKNWREQNGYTWHECSDCKTMQKVSSEVHGNVNHHGGISEIKSVNNSNGLGGS